MKRVLIAECKQEVSSFNPALSHIDDFVILQGDAILAGYEGARKRDEIAGALSVLQTQPDWKLVPAYSARAITSGGLLAAKDFTRLAGEFVDSVRAARPVDGVYLALHGAMAAEGEDDPEGYLLSEIRKILGAQVPVVASYDLHGIPTDRMFRHADASAVYQTYPHVDFYETGQRAARLLARLMEGNAHPVTAKVYIPALVRGNELITEIGAIRYTVNAARELETYPGVLSAGVFWGNPFTDTQGLGSYTFVTTDGDAVFAEREAIRLANLFWQHHDKMQVSLSSMEDAIGIARTTKGTTILVDAADAPSSGAPGDSDAILKVLLAQHYPGRALIPIVDPMAVRSAFAAGIGATIRTRVGGAVDTQRHQPVEVEGQITLLSDGYFPSESFGERWYSGDTAVLQTGAITLILTSRPVSLYDRSLFFAHGQDPKHFDLVVVKSPHCQPHMFREWAAAYVDVDAPGSTSANLRSLGHTRCPRPIFPLDDNVAFTPKAVLFSRDPR